jgi:hypothetical protein
MGFSECVCLKTCLVIHRSLVLLLCTSSYVQLVVTEPRLLDQVPSQHCEPLRELVLKSAELVRMLDTHTQMLLHFLLKWYQILKCRIFFKDLVTILDPYFSTHCFALFMTWHSERIVSC